MDTRITNVVRVFNRRSYHWKNDRMMNEYFVRAALDDCYESLQLKGYLFLNRVYLALGLPQTKEGQVAGWIYNKKFNDNILWTIWHNNDDEVDVHITFEPMANILDALPSEEEL